MVTEYAKLWYYFREGITFTAIGNNFSARLNGAGYLFDTKGPTMFGDHLTYVCGFVNSVVFDYYNRMLCKQITKSGDSVNLVPFYYGDQSQEIENLVESSVSLSQNDWDSYETSWDFICHPLVANQQYAAACHPNEEASPEHYLYAAYQMWLAATGVDSNSSKSTRKNSTGSLLTSTACGRACARS